MVMQKREMTDREYKKSVFLNKLEKSKNQYKEGKIYSARTFFKKMREKYGY